MTKHNKIKITLTPGKEYFPELFQLWPEWKTGGVDYIQIPISPDKKLPKDTVIWELAKKSELPQSGIGINIHIEDLEDKKKEIEKWLENPEKFLQIETSGISDSGFQVSDFNDNQVKWLISLEKWTDLAFLEVPPEDQKNFGLRIKESINKEEIPGALVLIGDWCLKNRINNITFTPPVTPSDSVTYIRLFSSSLRSLSLKLHGVHLVSCPTCSRCHADLRPLAHETATALKDVTIPLEVAVMGCEVNGPGEAKAADVGIAFGEGVALLFEHGEIKKEYLQI